MSKSNGSWCFIWDDEKVQLIWDWNPVFFASVPFSLQPNIALICSIYIEQSVHFLVILYAYLGNPVTLSSNVKKLRFS